MGAVDEAFAEVEAAPLSQVLGQPVQHSLDHSRRDPLLKSSVARLVWRITLGQVLPGRACSEDPEDSVQNVPRIPPRPPAASSPDGLFLR